MTRLGAFVRVVAIAAAALPSAHAAIAQPAGKEEAVKPSVEDHPLTEIWSGYHFQSDETRAMQDDEEANPAMAFYRVGEELWPKVEGKAQKSCETCHGDAAKSMRRAGARFPVYDPVSKKMINIEARINLCREKFMEAERLGPDSEALLALTVYVKRQGLGSRVAPQANGAAAPFFDKGKTFFETRQGQLDMSCKHCHNKYVGKQLRGITLTQGQTNGFPAFKLSSGKTVPLHRQINACLARMKAAPLLAESEELANLELYLAWRGQGLPVETPAVREHE